MAKSSQETINAFRSELSALLHVVFGPERISLKSLDGKDDNWFQLKPNGWEPGVHVSVKPLKGGPHRVSLEIGSPIDGQRYKGSSALPKGVHEEDTEKMATYSYIVPSIDISAPILQQPGAFREVIVGIKELMEFFENKKKPL